MEILIINIIWCFVVTWIIVIHCNSLPDSPSFIDRVNYEEKIRSLENDLYFWRVQVNKLKQERGPMCHYCHCPNFELDHDYKTKYYAVDKERQDLVDIIVKGQKSAEQLAKELSLSPNR